MSRTAALLALVSALVGLAASVAAAYVHYHLLRDPSYTSFCDVSATVSCSQVYSSRYGSVGGVPVAIFGAIWFAFAALAVARRADGAASGAGERAGVSVRRLDARAGRGPVSRVRVVRHSEDGVHPVRDHVCRRDRALSGVRRGEYGPSHVSATSCVPGSQDPRLESARAGRSRCSVLGGAASTLAFFPRDGASVVAARQRRRRCRGRGESGPALRIRAAGTPRSRA